MKHVILSSSRGTLVLDGKLFLLHRLELSAPILSGAAAGVRKQTMIGYILPEGETEAQRAAEMEAAQRQLCRIVCDPDGFIFRWGDRQATFMALTAPEFSAEPPLSGVDASMFTVTAVSAGEDGCFTGASCSKSVQGQIGNLVFPAPLTKFTLLGSQAQSGTMYVENPGDQAAGFILTVVAMGGTMDSFTLSRGEEVLQVNHPLSEGRAMCIDTRPGQKDVTSEGVSILGDTNWRSTFFSLEPGENILHWSCTGTGYPNMVCSLTPRYLTGGVYGYSDI